MRQSLASSGGLRKPHTCWWLAQSAYCGQSSRLTAIRSGWNPAVVQRHRDVRLARPLGVLVVLTLVGTGSSLLRVGTLQIPRRLQDASRVQICFYSCKNSCKSGVGSRGRDHRIPQFHSLV